MASQMTNDNVPSFEKSMEVLETAYQLVSPFLLPVFASLGNGAIHLLQKQKEARLKSFLEELKGRIDNIEEVLNKKINNGAGILLETAIENATSPLYQDKIHHLVSLVTNGINGSFIESQDSLKCMRLLGELTLIEILLLNAYYHIHQGDNDFIEHSSELKTLLCCDESDKWMHLKMACVLNLISLGMLESQGAFGLGFESIDSTNIKDENPYGLEEKITPFGIHFIESIQIN